MSPLFLVGCGLLVAAVLLGASGLHPALWLVTGAAGLAVLVRGATTTPQRRIRSHSGAKARAKAQAKRRAQASGGPARAAKRRRR